MSSWWRRQRLALVALLAAAFAVTCAYVWLDVIPVVQDEVVQVTTADGGSADIDGQTITLASARWDEYEAPAGSRTISVRLDVTGGEDAGECGPLTLTEGDDGRTWTTARAEVDAPLDAGEAYCTPDSGPYVLFSVYVVPADAAGPFWLDVGTGHQQVVRFALDL